MNTHKNARLTYARRVELARRALARQSCVSQLAVEFGVSRRTVHKWRTRYATEGEPGLRDRSSRPQRSPRQLPRYRCRQILHRRQQRWSSLKIAHYYQLPLSTVVTVQRRLGLNHVARLEPARPVVRYEHERPGDLLHVDVKKLGKIGPTGHRVQGNGRRRVRGIGWEYVHVAVDDCTRLSYSEVLPRENGLTTATFLARALTWFATLGIQVRAILTDNGAGYRSTAVHEVVALHSVRHRRTKPYRPQTNGKAERFIRTLTQEWAYARRYRSSAYRALALRHYLQFYNTERRHTALKFTTPAARLAAML